jgi:hypothetical protein
MTHQGETADDDRGGSGDPGRTLDQLTAVYDDERVRRVIDALIHPGQGAASGRAAVATAEPPAPAVAAADVPDAVPDVLGLCRADTWRRLLEVEHACAARYDAKTTVIQLEVADIAVIETVLGETAADRLVGVLADTVRVDTRAADTFARISRWRIAGLLPHTDGRTADAAIRRISEGFGRRVGGGLPILLAAGRAEVDPSLDPDATMARAQGAMTVDPRRAVEVVRRGERVDVAPVAAPEARAVRSEALPELDGRDGELPRRTDRPVPDSLRDLERLRAEGLISDEEYRKARRRVLRRV